MQLKDVTNSDGKMCAQLINLLKTGRWDFSGADALTYGDVTKWVHSLALAMAQDLKSQSQLKEPPQESFSIESMGKLPVAKPKGKRK